MARRRRGWRGGAVALAALVGACARLGDETQGVSRLSFEETAAPEVFTREGPALRDGPDGAPGLWAVVADLPRPERAVLEHVATGASVTVALFTAGSREAGPAIRISGEAADALGIGARTDEPVRVTALRREPRLRGTDDGF